jgi:hypothetical protein
MGKTSWNAAIALGVAGAIFLGLQSLRLLAPGFDPGASGVVLPTVVAFGLWTGLNARAGNRKTPVADQSTRVQALAFKPEPGHGSLVFLRTKRYGPGVGFDVTVDGEAVVQLMTSRFAIVRAAAGRHRIFADIPGALGPSAVQPAEIELADGAVLFFRVAIVIGLLRSSLRLDPVPDTAALRAELARTPMVQPEPRGSLTQA